LSSTGKEYGALHIAFDIYNNNAGLMGIDRAVLFGIGRYDATVSSRLGSSANRQCDLSFYSGDGTKSQHELRCPAAGPRLVGSYVAQTSYHIDIYLNDSNAGTQKLPASGYPGAGCDAARCAR